MAPKFSPIDTRPFVIELREWEQIDPKKDPRLKGFSLANDSLARRKIEALRGRLDVREGLDGLEIASTSFVGQVEIGPVRISITPKLESMPLAQLLRYAYGLRDVAVLDKARSPIGPFGFHDLLISLLAAEVEELVRGGLARRYVQLVGRLDSPRGRILVDQIIRQGGLRDAQLPCRHFERRADWHLNQVLRAGLESAARIAADRELQRRIHRLSAMFDDVDSFWGLSLADIDKAERELTRLTDACRPALTIIRLLHEAYGLAFDPSEQTSPTPGFLFDMNSFFQRLLSRFLHANLISARISDELVIRNLFAYSPKANPKGRRVPVIRPDYALFRDDALRGLLDAKYRDIWDRGFSPEWLYQLSIYALASPSLVSVLLYASMASEARDEQIYVHQPIPRSNKGPASVILRPVSLTYLAHLLSTDKARGLVRERRQYAEELTGFRVRERVPAHQKSQFLVA